LPYESVAADNAGATSARVVLDGPGVVTVSGTGQLSGHMATATVAVTGATTGAGRGGILADAQDAAAVAPGGSLSAGLSWLTIAALVVAGAVRVLLQRSKALSPALHGGGYPSVAAMTPHRRPGRKSTAPGGKHRKR